MASTIIQANSNAQQRNIFFMTKGQENPIETNLIAFSVSDDLSIVPIFYPQIPKAAVVLHRGMCGRHFRFNVLTLTIEKEPFDIANI